MAVVEAVNPEGQAAQHEQPGHRHPEDDRIDRDAALLTPVHVLEVQNQGELVQDERDPDTEQRPEQVPPR